VIRNDRNAWEDAMGRIAISLAVLALVGAMAAEPALAQPAPGSWTLKAPMPAPRGETAAIAFGGKLYAIGGNVLTVGAPFAKSVPRNEEYDPATDRWRVLAPMPVGRDHLGLAVVNGKIYSFGGFTYSTHQGAGTDVFEYDPASDKWRSRAPLKAPRASTGAAVIGGKIHVIGGRGDPMTTVTTHAVYDPATDTWTDAAPLPKARDHMVLIEAEGKIHAIGGRLGASTDRTDQHDIYDPATDSWSSGAPLKTPRSGLAGALYRGMILVLGGELAPNTFVENEGYDLKTKSWVTLAPMPEGRHGFGGDVVGPNAYFVGGSLKPGSGGVTDQLIMYTLP
jgi:N-acetylneuraminic acid mutarotase